MKNKKSLSLLALGVLTAVVVSQAVLASPPGPPPSPNSPSATFNSVTATPASGAGVIVTGVSGSDAITANNNINTAASNGISASAGSLNSYGVYAYNSLGAGIKGKSDAAAASFTPGVGGTGVGIGVSGAASDAAAGLGGYFTGRTGVQANSTVAGGNGISASGKGSGAGISAYNNDGVASATGVDGQALGTTGRGGHFQGGLWGIYSEAVGAGATAGHFVNPSGTSLNIASGANAIEATGPSFFNGGVAIRGPISNDSASYSGHVQINDGVYIIGTSRLNSGTSGDTVLELTMQNGTGLHIDNAIGGGYGAIIENGLGGWLQLANPDGSSINANGDIKTVAHVKAGAGIGQIYKISAAAAGNITEGAPYGTAGTVTCNGTDRILSCGIDYSGSGNAVLSQVSMTGTTGINSCTVYAYNPVPHGASYIPANTPPPKVTSAKAYAMCYNPNGSTW